MTHALSVLVPVYEFDIRPLARRLAEQRLPVPERGRQVEFLFYDDGSSAAFRQMNEEVQSLRGFRYKELGQNLGRSGIRNLLAREARGRLLLFLDCDAMPPDEDFLLRYLQAADERSVLCGGTAYPARPPEDPKLYLRWHYGRKREQKTAAQRRKNPRLHFHSFHFMAPRNLMLRLPFDESLKQYGHEDTFFAFRLEEEGIPIRHFDNPALHLGLEPAARFLEKTEQGIRNLLQLKKAHPRFSLRLLEAAEGHKNLPLPRALLTPLKKHLLHNRRPSLLAFDLYKLLYLRKCAREKDFF